MTLGNKIAHYRREHGMTQEALANVLGVTNQAVSKWESGQSCPDIALLPPIADLFGITLDELFDRAAPEPAPAPEPEAAPQPEAAPPALPWADDGTLRVVLYVGHKLIGAHPAVNELHFCYEGPALNVHSEISLSCGSVGGNATAGGDINCDNIYGSVEAQGDVHCDDVYGSVRASGDVSCDIVEGNVEAGGNVECDEISGDIRAEGDVHCDHAEDCTITAAGGVYVDEMD